MTKSQFTIEYERFRLLLVDARRECRLTQAQVAGRLHRPQSFVSKYERGERRLDVIEFVQVARVLGLDPCRFLQRIIRDGKMTNG